MAPDQRSLPLSTVKRKHKDYLCTSEELEVAEVEAGFAPVEFPVVNISTGKFSPIASKSLSDDIHHIFRIILKAVTELSSKIDRLIAVCERLAMGVSERRIEDTDIDAITFPLRTHDELRSLETTLENKKFRDHFLASQALSDVTVSSLFALLRTLLYCWYVINLSHNLTR
ncbi:unnamed protein product [Schistosoma margrebowiei]|uniref:Uncharacterized protein n=1 Tax=Schistosoma margrebowiei TaxID=48269 RepID=A0A183M2Y2_9TREM|nr:unnamed protein product [Schistosoma margrebowiei]